MGWQSEIMRQESLIATILANFLFPYIKLKSFSRDDFVSYIFNQ